MPLRDSIRGPGKAQAEFDATERVWPQGE